MSYSENSHYKSSFRILFVNKLSIIFVHKLNYINMQLSGTKQDWSKIYALIQLLLKGTIENTEIQKIIRKDESGEIVYHISSDIIHIKQGEEYVQISRQACKDFSSFLFSATPPTRNSLS